MTSQFEHLELRVWESQLPRRPRPGRSHFPPINHRKHGRRLLQQAEQVSRKLRERITTAPRGINPKFVFKIILDPKADLTDDHLRQLGLNVLARDTSKAIVVFPSNLALLELKQKLRNYAKIDEGPKYDYLSSIKKILELNAEDRIGKRLREEPLNEGEEVALDIELWYPGTRNECIEKIDEIRTLLEGENLRLTDWYIGAHICLLRGRVNKATLEILLNLDYVKEIDRRPSPSFDLIDVMRIDLPQITIPEVSASQLESMVGILIIDSGVMQGHPLIGPVLGDAQVFPDTLRQRIRGGPSDGDERTGGHGTAVAGIAVYNDVGEQIRRRSFIPTASIYSARVTDENNEYDPDELVENQLSKAIEYFIERYPKLKVVNISLGDSRLIYTDDSYQFRLAALIDELAYKYQDRQLIFVVAAGYYLPNYNAETLLRRYPKYLIANPDARVIEPATSALAITVGGLSYGAGRHWNEQMREGTERLIAGERGWPSPFTRTGWGVDGSIKPEVVDFAGDLRFERGIVPDPGGPPVYAGLPTTAKYFAPPGGRLFRTVIGTSFAAPRIANLAAQLFREYPDASSNLIRVLIGDSSRVPESRPDALRDKEYWDEDIMRIYGYGQPDYNRARWSNENRVLLIHDSEIEIDNFRLFTIPTIPSEFLRVRGDKYITVTMAFDPPTRHTRADSYLGVTMEFALFRNLAPEQIEGALKAWTREETEDFEDEKVPTLRSVSNSVDDPIKIKLNPGTNKRKKGTFQKGIAKISSSNWKYDGKRLVLAVICQRKWAPVDISTQRFAIIVSL